MKDLLFLDTHIILWSVVAPDQLSRDVKRKIEQAQEQNRLAICSISLWEISMLNLKGKINIFEPVKDFLESISNLDGLRVIEINAEIAAESTLLVNFHGDPADRIIVASTRVHGGTLITRDDEILKWATLGYIKSIEG